MNLIGPQSDDGRVLIGVPVPALPWPPCRSRTRASARSPSSIRAPRGSFFRARFGGSSSSRSSRGGFRRRSAQRGAASQLLRLHRRLRRRRLGPHAVPLARPALQQRARPWPPAIAANGSWMPTDPAALAAPDREDPPETTATRRHRGPEDLRPPSARRHPSGCPARRRCPTSSASATVLVVTSAFPRPAHDQRIAARAPSARPTLPRRVSQPAGNRPARTRALARLKE